MVGVDVGCPDSVVCMFCARESERSGWRREWLGRNRLLWGRGEERSCPGIPLDGVGLHPVGTKSLLRLMSGLEGLLLLENEKEYVRYGNFEKSRVREAASHFCNHC